MDRRDLLTLLGSAALLPATTTTAMPNQSPAPDHLSGNPAASFSTQPWNAQGRLVPGPYDVERVVFPSGGMDVVGNLFVPTGPGRKAAIVLIGPVAYVKEQAPLQYASRLAREGFVTLIFDPRFHGESAGIPRRWESRHAKVEDLGAALDFLARREEVDSARLQILGVCQGANWAAEAAAQDARVRAVALVAGHYLMPETANLYVGGVEKVAARLAKAQASKEAFERKSQVDYIPIVSLSDPEALLTARPIHDFYYHWADRGPFAAHTGLWENRITRMSELDIWGHRVDAQLARLEKPTLMVHSERAASGPKIPRALFEVIAAQDKQAVWLEGRNQIQFYQDPLTIDSVVPHLVAFYRSRSG